MAISKSSSGDNMVDLPSVTLVLADGTCPELAKLAIEDCLKCATFGDAVIFSDTPIAVDGARYVRTAPWRSLFDLQKFWWLELPYLISTPHVLFCQWDAWIVDPQMWTDEFLQYDYIGAPWWYNDGMNVGNGVGLNSIRLMKFVAEHQDKFPLPFSEDGTICRHHRPALEKAGFKWPTEQLASRFSFECTRPSFKSRHFMFHDAFNFPFVLEPVRLRERLELMLNNEYVRKTGKLSQIASGRRPLILERLAS
jgi:hypothetical protein